MERIIKCFYQNNERYDFESILYAATGQNTDGSITQKAFTETIENIIDDILGITNNE